MVKETRFLRFWRLLNSELVGAGSAPATIGQAFALYLMCIVASR